MIWVVWGMEIIRCQSFFLHFLIWMGKISLEGVQSKCPDRPSAYKEEWFEETESGDR